MTDTPQFDSTLAEEAIGKFLSDKLYPGMGYGMPFEVFHSDTPGVVALERIDYQDQKRFKWDELAAVVARETGFGVVCIAHCDWQVERAAEGSDEDEDEETDDEPTATGDDEPDTVWVDEEAVLIAFDIPDLDADYRDDYRNMINAISPQDAPSSEDFKARDRAVKIITSRKLELSGKLEYLEIGSAGYDAAMEELGRLTEYEADAANRGIHDALIELQFEQASDLIAKLPQPAEAPALPKL